MDNHIEDVQKMLEAIAKDWYSMADKHWDEGRNELSCERRRCADIVDALAKDIEERKALPAQDDGLREGLEELVNIWWEKFNNPDKKDLLNCIRSAEQLLAKTPDGWKPIVDAPKGSGEDGPADTRHPDYVKPPKLLLWTEEGPVVGSYEWYYHEGYGAGAELGESAWRDQDGGEIYPTHFRSLPAPPREGKG